MFFTTEYCVNYNNITDSWRKIGSPYVSKCDKNNSEINGVNWHRFVEPAGTRLPSLSPPQQLLEPGYKTICGTNPTAWMDGDHPTVADGVLTRQICFAWGGKYCYHNDVFQTKVAACNNPYGEEVFYVYQLHPPTICNDGYCAL